MSRRAARNPSGARPVSRTPTAARSVCSLLLRHPATHLLLSCSTPMHGILPPPRLHHPRHPNLNGTPAPQAPRTYPARTETAALPHKASHTPPTRRAIQSTPFLDSHDTTTSTPLLPILLPIYIAHICTHPSNTLPPYVACPAPTPCVTTQVFFRVGGRVRVRRRPTRWAQKRSAHQQRHGCWYESGQPHRKPGPPVHAGGYGRVRRCKYARQLLWRHAAGLPL